MGLFFAINLPESAVFGMREDTRRSRFTSFLTTFQMMQGARTYVHVVIILCIGFLRLEGIYGGVPTEMLPRIGCITGDFDIDEFSTSSSIIVFVMFV